MASLDEALNAALDHQEAGRLDQADTLYRRILAAVPEQPDALHLWGLLAAARGDLPSALDRIGRAIARKGTVADYHSNRAKLLAALGRMDEAADDARRAADLKPDDAALRFHAAGLLHDLGRMDEAAAQYGALLARAPDLVAVRLNLGLLREAQGRTEAAAASYRAALMADPAQAKAWRGLAAQVRRLGGPAVDHQRRAVLAGGQDDADALATLATLHKEAGNLAAAESAGRAALSSAPNRADVWNECGHARKGLGLLSESIAAYSRSLVLRPGSAVLLNNRADSRIRAGLPVDAEADARAAVAADAGLAAAWNTLGIAVQRQGRLVEALGCYDRARDAEPDHPVQARFNRAIALLTLGRFAEGWDEYEQGFSLGSGGRLPLRPFPQPHWDGTPPVCGALLVWAEQGLGDEVMFASLLPQLVEEGVRVVLECDPRLAGLFRRALPAVEVVARQDPPDPRLCATDIVAQCPAGSLPRHRRRSAAAFGGRQRPFLQADPALVARLRARHLDGRSGKRLVGISWETRNVVSGRQRSVAPERLARALDRPDVTLVSLQYGEVSSSIAAAAAAGVAIRRDPDIDPWTNIDGLAALTAAMDLVVSVDNSTVHLAGGLGRPVWALLPFCADWRWMADRADSVWYPSARLFRQAVPDDWDGVLASVAAALDEPDAAGGQRFGRSERL